MNAKHDRYIEARARRIVFINASGECSKQFAQRYPREHNGRWYTFDHSLRETVPLLRAFEGTSWAWGWKTRAAKALLVQAALT